MQGIIFTELRKYVETNLGDDAWQQLLAASHLRTRNYLPTGEYPDAEAMALVASAARLTGRPG